MKEVNGSLLMTSHGVTKYTFLVNDVARQHQATWLINALVNVAPFSLLTLVDGKNLRFHWSKHVSWHLLRIAAIRIQKKETKQNKTPR